MKLYYELNLEDFEAWSGARDTFERVRQEGKIEELEAILDDMYPDGMSETELNDLLWFEDEAVFEWLGITDEESEEDEADDEEVREMIAKADAADTFDEFCECFGDTCDHCPLYEFYEPCESMWMKRKGQQERGN